MIHTRGAIPRASGSRQGVTWWAGVLCLTGVTATPGVAALSRNAAGARNMGDAGAFTLDTAAETEREPGESGWKLESALQWQLSGRIQTLAELVPYESQSPDSGDAVSGFGDTEVTLSWLALEEDGAFPPLVLAAKVKLPTASNDEIGTGEFDFSGLFIVEKEIGELELAVELEYATFGSPSDEKLEDQVLYSLSAEYSLSDLLAVYVEVFGNSRPHVEESRTDAALLGAEIDVFSSEAIGPYLSFEFDTEEVGTARAGIEWNW